ncbi:hypothetical protein HGRIS_010787 [Hohenbuehelia grisea]|uniref:Uncharacterized protein n=1 Tax=Hohenbuehelia grisea TaxID=104357 RepID=A0ABR3IY99_9AGAR
MCINLLVNKNSGKRAESLDSDGSVALLAALLALPHKAEQLKDSPMWDCAAHYEAASNLYHNLAALLPQYPPMLPHVDDAQASQAQVSDNVWLEARPNAP